MTFTALAVNEAQYSELVVGAMTTAFYLGLGIASFSVDKLISSVGHIRVFAAFTAGLAIVTLCQGLFFDPIFWFAMRFAAGFFTAGLFIVVESWLLLIGGVQTRGRILAFYMIAFYAAQSLGQLLLYLPDVNVLLPYVVAALLCSLSIIPMTLLRIQAPTFEPHSQLNIIELFKLAPSGWLSCLCSGLVLGALYGLMPIFILQKTMNQDYVSWMMALIIWGGMLLQYPIGRLSDYLGRRSVLIGICLMILTLSILIILVSDQWTLVAVLLFLFGGFSFTIYPVSITMACDVLTDRQIVPATQGLVFVYSLGSISGPLLASGVLYFASNNGLFIYYLVISLILMGFISVRKWQTPRRVPETKFLSTPQTATPTAVELDPRIESESTKS
ncbi:MAG: MFS transporter [Legionellales bacterium]|nr:MFS transporter [Legionellales bacterium]